MKYLCSTTKFMSADRETWKGTFIKKCFTLLKRASTPRAFDFYPSIVREIPPISFLMLPRRSPLLKNSLNIRKQASYVLSPLDSFSFLNANIVPRYKFDFY